MTLIPQISEVPDPNDPQPLFDTKGFAMFESLVDTIDAMNEFAESFGLEHVATSTSNIILGTGLKVLDVAPNLGYVPGMFVTVAYTTDPTKYMQGLVKQYNSTTGALQFESESYEGTGTYANWTVSVAVRPSSKPNIPFAQTTGSSSAYVIDLEGAISELQDGMLFAVKFHTANVANATLQVFGVNPALTLRVVASDGAFVNAAAGDVINNYQVLCQVIEGATGLLITPARSVYTTIDVTANTTHTLETSLDRTFVCKTQGTVQILPLLSTMPEGGSVEFLGDVQLTFIQAQGSDLVEMGGANVASFGLGASEFVHLRKHNGKWRSIRSQAYRRITHAFATDITMPVNQVIEYAVTNVTSLELKVATGNNQRYRATFVCTDRPTANGTTPFLLNINNTTYAGTITPIGYFASASAASAISSTAVGGFPLSAATTGANFSFEFEISTSTFNKEISVEFTSVNSGGARFTGFLRARSSDTTTAITSLGTIDFVVPTTGILRLQRIE